jgi:hypothetical protein
LRPVNKGGKVVGEVLTDWSIWSVVENSAKQIGIEHFGATTSGVPAQSCAARTAAISNRSSFCWDTPPSRPQSVTWDPLRSFRSQLMTIWAL